METSSIEETSSIQEYDLTAEILTDDELATSQGGDAEDIDATLRQLWEAIKNDTYVHLIHANLRALKFELNEQQQNLANLWTHVSTTPAPTATPPPLHFADDESINQEINYLLGALKKFKNDYQVNYNLSVLSHTGTYYVYTHHSKINEQINNIMVRLNVIKFAYNLKPDVYENYFRDELNFFPLNELLGAASKNMFPDAQQLKSAEPDIGITFLLKTALLAAIIVLFIFLPFLAFFFFHFCKK